MKNVLIILGLMLMGCVAKVDVEANNTKSDLMNVLYQDLKAPKCPKNHTDSIIPIVYGYPSEELFAKADSGLVALGGCELMEEQNYCKIHVISF